MESADRLSELAAASPLLEAALTELTGERGLSNATANALVSSQVSDHDLSEFLSLVAREVQGQPLFGLAISLPEYIDVRKVGHEALDLALQPGRLDQWERGIVAGRMRDVKSLDAIRWCHSRLISTVRSDPGYHMFLKRHAEVIFEHCFDEMASYLLHPNRGPASNNVESFEFVIEQIDNPRRFVSRWHDWINDGFFDKLELVGSDAASPMYQCFNDKWENPRFRSLIDATHEHVEPLVKSDAAASQRSGMYHLVSMIDAKYRGSEVVLSQVVPAMRKTVENYEMIRLLRLGLQAAAAYQSTSDPAADQAVQSALSAIHREDGGKFTDYWVIRAETPSRPTRD